MLLNDLRLCVANRTEASKGLEEDEDEDLEGWRSGDDDDWDKEIADDEDDGDEVDNQKLQKLAAQVGRECVDASFVGLDLYNRDAHHIACHSRFWVSMVMNHGVPCTTGQIVSSAG